MRGIIKQNLQPMIIILVVKIVIVIRKRKVIIVTRLVVEVEIKTKNKVGAFLQIRNLVHGK